MGVSELVRYNGMSIIGISIIGMPIIRVLDCDVTSFSSSSIFPCNCNVKMDLLM